MDPVTGIGPVSSAWKADILPLNYTEICGQVSQPYPYIISWIFRKVKISNINFLFIQVHCYNLSHIRRLVVNGRTKSMTILSALALVACFCATNGAGTVNFVFGELMEMLVIIPSKVIVGINLTGNTSFYELHGAKPSHENKRYFFSFYHAPKVMVPPGGIEPPTCWVWTGRSNHLSYVGIYKAGYCTLYFGINTSKQEQCRHSSLEG